MTPSTATATIPVSLDGGGVVSPPRRGGGDDGGRGRSSGGGGGSGRQRRATAAAAAAAPSSSSSATSASILFLGLAKNLDDVGSTLLESIGRACGISSNNGVGVWITYSSSSASSSSPRDDGGGADRRRRRPERPRGAAVAAAATELRVRQFLTSMGCADVVLERDDDYGSYDIEDQEEEEKKGAVVETTTKRRSGSGSRSSRYDRLAELRSRQRSRVLIAYSAAATTTTTNTSTSNDNNDNSNSNKNNRYDVVANVDFDLLSLPPAERLSELAAAIAVDGGGNGGVSQPPVVVCANGYETWFGTKKKQQKKESNGSNDENNISSSSSSKNTIEGGIRMFYDTLPAIDRDGNWYYETYSRNWLQVLTFGQRRLFRRILTSGSSSVDNDEKKELRLWPMRSCFGGLAMYGWSTFASPHCDYVRSKISLPSSSSSSSSSPSPSEWRFPARYTLSGTPDGDACEHAVFQLCLGEEYRQLHNNNNSQAKTGGRNDDDDDDGVGLVAGIHPNLIVQREANILSTDEAVYGVVQGVLALLILTWLLCVALSSCCGRVDRSRSGNDDGKSRKCWVGGDGDPSAVKKSR